MQTVELTDIANANILHRRAQKEHAQYMAELAARLRSAGAHMVCVHSYIYTHTPFLSLSLSLSFSLPPSLSLSLSLSHTQQVKTERNKMAALRQGKTQMEAATKGDMRALGAKILKCPCESPLQSDLYIVNVPGH